MEVTRSLVKTDKEVEYNGWRDPKTRAHLSNISNDIFSPVRAVGFMHFFVKDNLTLTSNIQMPVSKFYDILKCLTAFCRQVTAML